MVQDVLQDRGIEIFIVGEKDKPPELVACFEPFIPENVVMHVAFLKPLRACFRDSGLTDSTKASIKSVFDHYSPGTVVRVL